MPRKSIPAEVTRRLFMDSAGYCQNPDCLRELFPEEMGGLTHIAERAHIIPYGNGPRIEQKSDANFEVNSFDNLMMLCPSCHTIIDKNEKAYPRELLLGWKANHLAAIVKKQGIVEYATRKEVRQIIEAIMLENKSIWQTYAPIDGVYFEYDPESTSAQVWIKRVRSIILPNHFRIQNIIEMNTALMTSAEKIVFSRYKEHVRTLTERHIGEVSGGVVRYPTEMDGLFL